MTVTIGRRELLIALGGAVVAWPLATRGQSNIVNLKGKCNNTFGGRIRQ